MNFPSRVAEAEESAWNDRNNILLVVNALKVGDLNREIGVLKERAVVIHWQYKIP